VRKQLVDIGLSKGSRGVRRKKYKPDALLREKKNKDGHSEFGGRESYSPTHPQSYRRREKGLEKEGSGDEGIGEKKEGGRDSVGEGDKSAARSSSSRVHH